MNYINGLHFNNLRGDIYGGLTAAVIALPLAMAFGVASGVGPIAGIYGAIFVGFFAAIFGGTPAQVSGPTGPMTVVMAAIFTQYTGMFPDNPAQGAALAFTVVIMGGLFQTAFGILKLGKFIELVPHPVVSGFMSGIGVIIILLQLGPFIGSETTARPLQAFQLIPAYIRDMDAGTTALGMLILIIVYGIPRFLPRLNHIVPSPLFALIAGTMIYLLFMGPGSTPVIGDIPTGFPEFIVPVIDMELLFQMVTSAITLAGLGAIDSLLTSLVADNITRSQHRSDRELIGQGIGNMIAGLFGGLPGAGATMRTVVNVNAGGRTPISGALHAVILLAMVLGAGALAQDIPKAVLAGILIKVGTDIIDWDYLKRLRHAPIPATVIMTTVFVITVAIDLLLAVGVGMVMASFYFMHRITQVQIANMRPVRGGSGELAQNPEEKAIMEEAGEQILLFHLSGPMSFSSAKAMVRMHAGIQDYQVMLLDLTEVPMVDFTSSKALEDIIIDTLSEGNQIYLVGVQQEVHRLLSKLGVIARLPDDRIYPLRIDALRDAMKFIRQSDG